VRQTLLKELALVGQMVIDSRSLVLVKGRVGPNAYGAKLLQRSNNYWLCDLGKSSAGGRVR